MPNNLKCLVISFPLASTGNLYLERRHFHLYLVGIPDNEIKQVDSLLKEAGIHCMPGALWLMHGWVNEALARAPFACSR